MMNGLLYMLSSETASELQTDVQRVWNDNILPIVSIVLWVLIAVLAVVFVVKGVTTALAVMKAADDPQARQEKINGFKFLAIGLGIAIVILSLAQVILNFVVSRNTDVSEATVKLF